MPPQLTILVADDVELNLDMIDRFLSSEDYRVIRAESGKKALELFESEQPDMVLMDVMMPEMDGYEATEQIRARFPDRWVPIIFLSALSENVDQIRGLEAGGDDYLIKPINLVLLEAKILAMRRIAEMQNKLAQTTRELQRLHEEAEQEQEMAHELMTRMVSVARIDDPALRVWQQGATRFSGDLIAATRTKNGRLYLLSADSMGHGLPAALPLLPISHIFYEMAERGYSVSSIVEEMNNNLCRQMPTGRFVTATLACVDSANAMVEIWNGANPPALFVDTNGCVIKRFASAHPPLGVEKEDRFVSASCVWQWPQDGHLILHSDGLTEAENSSGTAFGESGLLNVIQGADDRHVLGEIVGAVNNHLGGEAPHDDMSVIVVQCNVDTNSNDAEPS